MKFIYFFVALLAITQNEAIAQQNGIVKDSLTGTQGPSTQAGMGNDTDSVSVTIILRHQQDKNLTEIRRICEAQGFWDVFPPQEARVVSWTLAIGMGHVVVLKVPGNAIRRLNLAIQNGAWGAYNTEVYISYDYKPIWEDYIEQREEAKAEREDDKK
jgi:hypothetical protein